MVIIGTPLNDQQFSYEPIWKQEAKDSLGRKRFHGAFTGGFTAGYHNTVGSKEGWTPASFKSSRGEKSSPNSSSKTFSKSTILDFMDEEDYNFEELNIVYTIKNIGWKLLGLNPPPHLVSINSFKKDFKNLDEENIPKSQEQTKRQTKNIDNNHENPNKDQDNFDQTSAKSNFLLDNDFDEDEMDIYRDNLRYNKFIEEERHVHDDNHGNRNNNDINFKMKRESERLSFPSSSNECVFMEESEKLNILSIILPVNIKMINDFIVPQGFKPKGLEKFDFKDIISHGEFDANGNNNKSRELSFDNSLQKTISNPSSFNNPNSSLSSREETFPLSDRFTKGKYDLGINDEYFNPTRSSINSHGEMSISNRENERKSTVEMKMATTINKNQNSSLIEEKLLKNVNDISMQPLTDKNKMTKFIVDWIPNEMLCKRLNAPIRTLSSHSYESNANQQSKDYKNQKNGNNDNQTEKLVKNSNSNSNSNNGDNQRNISIKSKPLNDLFQSIFNKES